MSLSRPVKFPLLKLPWLCIEAVVKCWDVFEIIFLALTSKKTRRIVKSFKIPLNGIRISVSETSTISLCNFSKFWFFSKSSLKSSFDNNSKKIPLMFRNNPIPLYTSRANAVLTSYTHRKTVNALKMAIEFLNEVFNCSVERVEMNGDNFSESGNIGVKSTVNLCINQSSTQPFGYAQSHKLNLLLENLEVTGLCTFWLINIEKNFYCDPKLFKCKKMVLLSGSANWVTRETLLQFEVPQLKFEDCPFSVEDILSFITNWFHSDDKKLEYLHIEFRRQVWLEEFQTSELDLVPFSERNRVPPLDSFRYFYVDFSKGLEIVRNDGLQATIHVGEGNFMFYIWHDQ